MKKYPFSAHTSQHPLSQPDYQQAPGHTAHDLSPAQSGATQTPRRRSPAKKQTLLWIGLFALLLLAIGTGSYYYFMSRSTPQKTLQLYCSSLKNNDAQGLYTTLSTEQQTGTSISKLQEGLRLLSLVTGGFQNCTFDAQGLQSHGTTMTDTVTLVTRRGKVTHINIQLTQENGQWRVSKSLDTP